MSIKIDFARFVYFPLLRVRQSEMQGFETLDDITKDQILPLLTLGKWRNTDGIEKGLERINKALGGRPYMLDLSKESSHQNDFIANLLNPDRNFESWVNLISTNPEVLPVVQISSEATIRNVVRQALAFENAGRQPVFRIRDYKRDTESVIAALTAMDMPEQSIVVIDAGYLRELSTLRIKPGIVQSVLHSINQINSEVDTQIVVAGTSYPRATTDFLDANSTTSGRIDMIEWDLFGEISDYVLYGDHAGVHSVVYDDAGGTFLPKVDYMKDAFWNFERRPEIRNAEGFVEACRALFHKFPEIESDTCWGAEMISRTAQQNGLPTINAPATALAVRVNIHITHQTRYMAEYYQGPDDEDREWD